MRIHVELAGFGHDRPAVFANGDATSLTVPNGAMLNDILATLGLGTISGLSILLNDTPITQDARQHTLLKDTDRVTILHAMEGG